MMISIRAAQWRLFMTAIAAGGIALTSYADTAPSSNTASPAQAGALDEIVVTAEKRSESVNSVPMSIAAFTGDQLMKNGIRSTADLGEVVPGFSTVTSYLGSPVYYLRGVGYYDTSVAARPAVTIYADEAPIPYSVMAMGTTLDLERVEVLKGPQGTLFGSNSTGGAINFIAAKPTNTFAAGADVSYGRFNDTFMSAFVSGPLFEHVNGRLAVSHEGAGNWQYNYINGDQIGAKDITSMRGTLDVRPTDKLRALFTFSGTYDGSDVQVGQLVGKNLSLVGIQPAFLDFPLSPMTARATAYGNSYPNGAVLRNDNKELQGTIRVDYDLTSDITLTSLTSMATNTLSFGQNGGGTTLQLNATSRVGDLRSVSQELRASGVFDGAKGHWIVGGNYEHDTTSENSTNGPADQTSGNVFDFMGLPPFSEVPSILNTKYASLAGFGDLDFDLTDQFTSHLGVRYTDTRTEFSGCTVNAGNLSYGKGIAAVLNATGSNVAPIPAGACFVFAPAPGGGYTPTVARGSQDQGSVSWRAGLDWKPIPDTLVYGSVSRGFKAGASSNIGAVFISQYMPVPQEELTSYEIGAKTNIVPLTHINAALFYYQYKDKQVQGTEVVPIFGPLNALVSIPKSNIKGAEFDVTTKPLAGLTLGVQGTYLRSVVEGNFEGTTALGGTANFNGASFPNTPKWQTAASAEYSWAVSGDLTAFVNGRDTYRSGTYGDFVQEPLLKIPGYSLVDAAAGVRTDDGKWSVQLWGHNITNRYYWNSQVANVESIVRYAGQPVTYGISGSYRY